MKIPPILLALFALPACTYLDGPGGRFFSLDLPVESTHTVSRTVRVDAAPGTTVIMSESSPLDGYYRPALNPNGGRTLLRQAASNDCLSLERGSVPAYLVSRACHGRTNQQFMFNGPRLSVNGLCLEAMGGVGSPVAAAACHHGQSQHWIAEGDHIRSAANGLCLEGSGGAVRLQYCNNGMGQRFYR
ncbi:ricin-type beta-trefoil lectin domain protein [Eikenella sp. S3360]|uniref:Ricin-type beta-trefoil lectin domain protein n=1 Tax=Eikenella glucosivorans TaxID=2766967 RepID=A0ABS0N981_9NEIS|nr:RICIN domain-containing protein [Eikenella glucosivorans]MBH5328844.1 ricin-type beta-trefoil lectin domain protein [Eikenella glucosivorans]